jgi:hypothetical protein
LHGGESEFTMNRESRNTFDAIAQEIAELQRCLGRYFQENPEKPVYCPFAGA